MLDRQRIRKEPDYVRAQALRKGVPVPIDEFLELDQQWRELLTELEQRRSKLNQVSKEVGRLMASDRAAGERARAQAASIKQSIAALEDAVKEKEAALRELELQFPNLPDESVPDGDSEEQNVVVSEFGEKPETAGEPVPHWEIAEDLQLIDFTRGAKVAGSGFLFFTGAGAKLQRALVAFMLDHHTGRNGYTEVYPPYLVNRVSLVGTGQLPKFEDDLYRMERDDLFLIPTAEVPVTNLHQDEILNPEDLPRKYVAFSGCFRREAGAAGKDTRGLLRIHQFDKVELVKIVRPETSFDELESLRSDAESVLQALGLHYRVTLICAGEMGFSNAKQYDLEVWAPGVGKYLEVSSVSNFTDFQARRANIRYRPGHGERPDFVHTLNASGVALPRLMAALLETYRQSDGTIAIPDALQPYFGANRIERP
ncbi:MAG: serine--tRNA ligase [Fimbriimonadales bacterium]|nr:MAG: serine--tRNA ligase [Fimbriimonadales bacterium]